MFKFIGWVKGLPIWTILVSIVGVAFLWQKTKAERAEARVKEAEAEIQRQIDTREVNGFEVVNEERAKQTEVKDAGDTHSDTDSYNVSI